MLATSLLLASLGPPMLGMSRVRAALHWMALAVAICRCLPELSLRFNCTPRYLMLFFHSISCSPRTIFVYWKDLQSVTSKASVFSAAIFRHLISNQRFVRRRLSLIFSSRILTSSATDMTSQAFAKPMILVPAGRSMHRKSSFMTFRATGPTRDPCGVPHVIFSLRDHLSRSYINHLLLRSSSIIRNRWSGTFFCTIASMQIFHLAV